MGQPIRGLEVGDGVAIVREELQVLHRRAQPQRPMGPLKVPDLVAQMDEGHELRRVPHRKAAVAFQDVFAMRVLDLAVVVRGGHRDELMRHAPTLTGAGERVRDFHVREHRIGELTAMIGLDTAQPKGKAGHHAGQEVDTDARRDLVVDLAEAQPGVPVDRGILIPLRETPQLRAVLDVDLDLLAGGADPLRGIPLSGFCI